MADTEWLPGVQLRQSVPPAKYTGLWGLGVGQLSQLSGRTLAAQVRWPGFGFLPTDGYSTFLNFYVKTPHIPCLNSKTCQHRITCR